MTGKEKKVNAIAINSIAKTDGYKAILALIDENCEACELIATDINNANSHGVLAFANGGIDILKRVKMQIEDLANLNLGEDEYDLIEP